MCVWRLVIICAYLATEIDSHSNTRSNSGIHALRITATCKDGKSFTFMRPARNKSMVPQFSHDSTTIGFFSALDFYGCCWCYCFFANKSKLFCYNTYTSLSLRFFLLTDWVCAYVGSIFLNTYLYRPACYKYSRLYNQMRVCCLNGVREAYIEEFWHRLHQAFLFYLNLRNRDEKKNWIK